MSATGQKSAPAEVDCFVKIFQDCSKQLATFAIELRRSERKKSAGKSSPWPPSLGVQNMPLFFFHQHLNGRLEKDRRGRRFPSVDDARVYAVHRISAILRITVSSTTDTYLATEVSDGEHTLCVVRAKVIIQR